jgi:hypothetical protein
MSIPGVRVDLSECITLWNKMTLSKIWISSTYPHFSLDMMKGRNGLSRREITLVMIL